MIGACRPCLSGISMFAQGTNARPCNLTRRAPSSSPLTAVWCALSLESRGGTGGQSGEVTLELQPRGSQEGGIHGEMNRLELHDCR